MKVPKGYEGQTILRRTLLGKDSVREYLRQLEVSTSERDVEVMTMSLNAAPDQLVKTLAVTYQEKGVEGDYARFADHLGWYPQKQWAYPLDSLVLELRSACCGSGRQP